MRRIYTRTGDKGETGLFAGPRVPKDHPRVEAIGAIDELNAVVGLVRAQLNSPRPASSDEQGEGRGEGGQLGQIRVPLLRTDSTGTLDDLLRDLQNLLFTIGADLATVADSRGLGGEGSPKVPCLTQLHLTRLEAAVDALTAPLPELTTFILPAGSMLTVHLHLARTVCRRAERAVVALAYSTPSPLEGEGKGEGNATINLLIFPFLNRLSTLFFVLARTSSLMVDGGEEKWEKG